MSSTYLKTLYLRNFRNYVEAEVSFSEGLNVLYGHNAQGKTNLLEAIYLIATGRSFRAQQLQEIIRFGESFFFLEAAIRKDGIEHTVQIRFDGKSKQLVLDGNSYGTLQHLLGLLPSVLYTPADTELIEGPPTIRRRLLNLHLAQRDPLYIHHLSRYWRAMKQRNTLLRSKQIAGIECWEIEMARSASALLVGRQAFIADMQQPLQENSKRLSANQEEHEMRFHPSMPLSTSADPAMYLKQLEKNRPREQHVGFTFTGPHRDDFSLWINGKKSAGFASEGQKRTTAASLRLAEWTLLMKATQTPALFAIDDLGLHLDELRQALLSEALQSLGQVFVTAPQMPPALASSKPTRYFLVSEGTIKNDTRAD